VAGGHYEEERAEPPVVPSLSKLKLYGNLVAAYSFDAFFLNATEKKAAAAAAGARREGGGPHLNKGVVCKYVGGIL
jgi:hypothetical protein